jgi:PAS domain S-box-containing protein
MNERTHLSRSEAPSVEAPGTSIRRLAEAGLRIARQHELPEMARVALESGQELSGAELGAFFYFRFDSERERTELVELCNIPASLLRAPEVLPRDWEPETESAAVVWRLDDVQAIPQAELPELLRKLPFQKLRVRSCLASAVIDQEGDLLGLLFYGHTQAAAFDETGERVTESLAAQAALAMGNLMLSEKLAVAVSRSDTARRLQQETFERLQQVMDSTTDGVALLDGEWRFTFVNHYANQLVAPGRDLTGVWFWDVFPDARGSVFEQRYSETMYERRPVQFTEYYAPLQLWAHIRVFPTAEGIAIFFQDVTQQRQAERQLVISERRLQQALDAGKLGTWQWNAANDLLDMDERAAAIFQTRAHAEISRRELRDRIVHQEDLHETAEDLRDVLKRGGIYSSEYRIQPEQGGQIWIAARGIAAFDESTGKVNGLVGTVQDITERKTQEATLRQTEKLAATGRLAATIAHEINNPLEAVTNLIFLCKTDLTVPPMIQRLLETADDELARVAQIAQQTLGFYRDTTRPGEIDLSALLENVSDLFSRKLRYKKLTCRMEIEPGLRIFGLQGEIRQVFSNLLVNAIDASTTGDIVIRAHRRVVKGRAGVSVMIGDHGGGIPPSVSERLFSPFFTTKQSVGTGLGLWVTKGMVEKHGGTIRYRTCTKPPTGTVFRVFLPGKLTATSAFDLPQPDILQ